MKEKAEEDIAPRYPVAPEVKVLGKDRERSHVLAMAVEQTTSIVVITDIEGTIEYVNPAFTAATGYTAEEVLGQHARRLSNLREEDEQHIRDVVRSGGEWRGELQNRTKDGELLWVLGSVSPIRNSEGAVTHFLGLSEDITQRKWAEEALSRAEVRHAALLEAMPDMMFRMSGDGVYLEFLPGEGMEPLVPPEEFLGKHIRDVMPGGVAKKCERYVRQALSSRATQVFEYQLVEGQRPVDYEARVVPCGDNEVLAIVRDITERKRAEEALRVSEERYRIFYEDNPSMYFTVDLDGIVLSVNRFGAEQLGYAPGELIGESVLPVFHEEDRDDVQGQLADCAANPGQTADWEFRKVRKDGSVLCVKETARAVRDTNGSPIVLIVCEDITARKEAEEALQQTREEIERRVENQLKRGEVYGLTFRELTVLHLVADGRLDKEIAILLGISPRTAQTHLTNILRKMGAATRTEAGVRALREGLIR